MRSAGTIVAILPDDDKGAIIAEVEPVRALRRSADDELQRAVGSNLDSPSWRSANTRSVAAARCAVNAM